VPIRTPRPLVPRSCRLLMSHVLVNTMETSKVLNRGVNVWCQAMLEWLNAIPGNSVIPAMPINVLTAKGMISMEMTDRIWEQWVNDRVWKVWQTL